MTKISAPGSGECEWPVKESDGTAASHRDTAPDGSGGAMHRTIALPKHLFAD